MTRTTPWRRTILQLRHIFFTDAATFMGLSFDLSIRAKGGADPTGVVRRGFRGHLVARQAADAGSAGNRPAACPDVNWV
jgi:hypothetical protein